MANWIKVEHTTPDKPEVIRMAHLLGIDQDAVLGKLVRVWSWADQNSTDGVSLSVTNAFLDRYSCQPGFAAAMRAVGWITGNDGDMTFPNFELHNAATAKKRTDANRRVARHREAKRHRIKSLAEGGGNGSERYNVTPESVTKPPPDKIRDRYRESVSAGAGETAPELWNPDDGPPCTPAIMTLKVLNEWIERIRMAYHRRDCAQDVRHAIRTAIDAGEQSPAEILSDVTECGRLARLIDAGAPNRFVSTAREFFGQRKWTDASALQALLTEKIARTPSASEAMATRPGETPTDVTASKIKLLTL